MTLIISHTIISFMINFFTDVMQEALKMARKYKKSCRVWILSKPYIAVNNPEDFQVP